ALIVIANGLTSNVRESVDLVARYGGEEFALILPETSKESAEEVANRIRLEVKSEPVLHYLETGPKRKVVSPNTKGAKPFRVTISIGIASYPDDASTYGDLIDRADGALYKGKSEKGDIVILA
ncbi:GGDEF domain-containing protein, partial [bacterium]|nr:GGDEF domain-containing protein [bacterium]